ncbi:MAG: hypothetical protein Q7O66_22245 [Dehalococcoidia bacterium]|nr:hypothetical protein [Dehalococcoidia bacterium]
MAIPHRNSPMQPLSSAERRAMYLDIMRRRVRAGSGSSLQLLLARESCPMPDLNALLSGERYVVVGGTATSLYMPLRTTKDVDILVSEQDASLVEQALLKAGASKIGSLGFTSSLGLGGTSWALADDTELDVLLSGHAWVKHALAHPNRDAAGLPIVALPYLVLMKLDASRSMDVGDLGRMLGGASEADLAKVRTVVKKHLPEASEDLESLIQLGKLEFQSAPLAVPPGPNASLPDTGEKGQTF